MSSWILASTSTFRRQLLESAGLSFESEGARVDERALEKALGDCTPDTLVRALARAKAEDVLSRHPGRVVVGADQMLALDGEIIGKPANAEEAAHRMRQFSGRKHRLLTGVAVLGGGFSDTLFVEETRISFRTLTEAEIQAYVESEEWIGCAGGYRIEGRGITLMDGVDGDYFNIIGLPLFPLLAALRERQLL